MAEDFPFSLKELLPLLHIIGRVNRTIDKVTRFIDRYGSMDLFPVKLQVPIAMTVYLLATFRDFRRGGEERDLDPSGHQGRVGFTLLELLVVLAILATGACCVLSGCNTTEGIGEDVEAAGDAISDAARDAND